MLKLFGLLFCLGFLYCADPYRLLTLVDKVDGKVKASYARYKSEHPERYPVITPTPAYQPPAKRLRWKKRAPDAPKPAMPSAGRLERL